LHAPKEKNRASIKPKKTNDPDPGTYDPNYPIISKKNSQVVKIIKSKITRYYDEEIKRVRNVPGVGKYNTPIEALRKLSKPRSLSMKRH